MPAAIPQSVKGARARCCHTCLRTIPLQACDSKFVCDCYPPAPFLMFSHSSLFQLECYSISDAPHQLSPDKVIRAHCCHHILMSHVERAVMVSFLLFFISPTIPSFLQQLLFSIKLQFWWPCRLPSLSQKGR